MTQRVSPVASGPSRKERYVESKISNLDTVWVLVAAFLVFFMHTGFELQFAQRV